MKNRDLIGSLFWIAFGIFFITGSLKAGLIRKGIPGPGFVPFISAIVLISLALSIFILSLRATKEGERDIEKDYFRPKKGSFAKSSIALLVLFAYGFFLEYSGYLLTTLIFMLFATRLVEPPKWRTSFIVAVMTAVVSYILFVIVLGIQLPPGVWEFKG